MVKCHQSATITCVFQGDESGEFGQEDMANGESNQLICSNLVFHADLLFNNAYMPRHIVDNCEKRTLVLC